MGTTVMITTTQDRQLLEQFVREKSQQAFAELFHRHSPWLYSVCLRRLHDPESAQDATQAVFMALARHAPKLIHQKTLSPWLHRSARYCAANLLRARRRRQRHESEAAAMRGIDSTENRGPDWNQIEPDLEPAMDQLHPADRAAILMRYYEQKSHPEIAQTLGISIEASQKRLSRALERLRAILVRNGNVNSTTFSAAVIGEMLARHAIDPTPPTLALPPLHAPLTPLAESILLSAKLTSMKIAASILLALMIPSGLMIWHLAAAAPTTTAASPPPSPATLATTVPASPPTIVKIPNSPFLPLIRGNEFLVSTDETVKRTNQSDPAGYIKSLLPNYLNNDQAPARRVTKIPATQFAGTRVRMSGWIKARNVQQWGALFVLFLDSRGNLVSQTHFYSTPAQGTMDWTAQQLVFDVPEETATFVVGSLLFGKGELWSDGLCLQTVGSDVPVTIDEDAWYAFSFFQLNYTATPDPAVKHDGHATVCLASTSKATVKHWISYNHDELDVSAFRGCRIRATLWVKAENVSTNSGPWINVFSPGNRVDNEGQKSHRPIEGSADWKQYSAEVDVPLSAVEISWGVVFNGTGKIWVDTDSAELAIIKTPAGRLIDSFRSKF